MICDRINLRGIIAKFGPLRDTVDTHLPIWSAVRAIGRSAIARRPAAAGIVHLGRPNNHRSAAAASSCSKPRLRSCSHWLVERSAGTKKFEAAKMARG